jgi:hypothetical protein
MYFILVKTVYSPPLAGVLDPTMGWEWDSNESSTDSSDEDAANIAINKGILFPNVGHKCLMAKDNKKKKVHVCRGP